MPIDAMLGYLLMFACCILLLAFGALVRRAVVAIGRLRARRGALPRATLLAIAMLACAHRRDAVHQAERMLGAEVSLADFHPAGGGADDRAAIQAAIDAAAGGTLRIPCGRWAAARSGGAYYALLVPANTAIAGESRDCATLALYPRQAASVRLLQTGGPGVSLRELTLDGDRANQDSNPQRHGFFVDHPGATIDGVILTGHSGDGLYFRSGTGHAVRRTRAEGNGRNGITLAGTISDVLIEDSSARANAAQQIDSEPGDPAHVDRVTIRRTLLDPAGASSDWALTICGSARGSSADWLVEDVSAYGGIYAAWAVGARLSRVTAISSGAKPALRAYRLGDVTCDHCDLTATAATNVVEAIGTGPGQAPSLDLRDSKISGGGTGVGVWASGFRQLAITNATITNPRAAGTAAIGARATDQSSPQPAAGQVLIRGTSATGWTRGLSVAGSGYARMGMVAVTGSQLGPLYLDDGLGELDLAVLSGVTEADVARRPAGSHLLQVGGSLVIWSER